MAPPRRSTPRQSSATPLKTLSPVKNSKRGASAFQDNAPTSKRSLRNTSQPPDQTNGVTANPILPEVQTQQSYAYGSTKTPLLPEQLKAREKMSLSQMAATIDQGILRAEQRFETHAIEAETNLTSQPQNDARNTRARRRVSREPSRSPREGSYESVNSEVRKTQRTAAWASSLDSDQLRNITEEESITDDETRRGTDPSSFPSGIFDSSYNYERGLRGPRLLERGATRMQMLLNHVGEAVSHIFDEAIQVSKSAATKGRDVAGVSGKLLLRALPYVGLGILTVLIATLVATFFSWVFCQAYTRTLCDPTSTSMVHMRLQSYCGSCKTFTLPENLTPEQQTDLSFMSKALIELRRQLHELESRVDSKADAKSKLFSLSLDELRERQRDIEAHIFKLENSKSSSSSGGHLTLMQKVNYFSPGAGAIINPYYTSPVLQRKFNLVQRMWLRLAGLTKYTANPPTAAIEAWEDIGDCFCSPGENGNIRLGVSMGDMIYPTEIVIEHYPASGSPNPQTAPREVEVWANFRHLSADQYAELGIWDLKGMNPIAPTMGKIGTVRYDARPGVNHIQTFRLDVNQGALVHSTDEVVVKVNSNHGAPHTCLYRVRLHGLPVTPHPQVAE